MSNLRILGCIVGLGVLFIALRQFRKKKTERPSLLLPLLIGFWLASISLVPTLASLPMNFFSMNNEGRGRLLSLLLMSSIALWLLILWERSKQANTKTKLLKMILASGINGFSHKDPLLPGALWIVIPVFNESENLRELLPKINDTIAGRPVHVLVVDDGSDDNSVAVAREHGCLTASLLVNYGGGMALKTGFEIAVRHGAEAIVTIDGDCQHDPADIEDVVKPILEGHADLVIGSRYLGQYERVSLIRSVGLHVFNQIINKLQGINISDCASGFRAIRAEELSKWQLTQEQYHTAEMILEAAKGNARIAERPISVQLRSHGESKKGKDILYGLFFLRTILKTWLR